MKSKILPWLAFIGSICGHAAILYPQPPAGGKQAAIRAMSLWGPRAAKKISEFTAANPIKNYSINLTNLVSGKLLLAAEDGQWWTYPFKHGTNEVNMEWVTVDKKSGKASSGGGMETGNYRPADAPAP